MPATKKSFCIICVANYCRSPVIEILLNKNFGNNYEFFSAGISPIALPSMDPRSLKFLKDNNISHDFHTPRRISKRMLDYFDIFLAVDPYVLNHLSNTYPKYKKKFRSLTIQFKDIDIVDPYMLQADDYIQVMKDIKYVSEQINLEKYIE